MPRRPIRSTPSHEEKRNISEFFKAAARRYGSQLELERLTGLRQPTINGIINQKTNAGHRSLFAMSQLTGVSIEDIVSGVGTLQLKSRTDEASQAVAQINRLRAARALAELFAEPLSSVMALFDEMGLELPVEIPATVWFDSGRAAIERRITSLGTVRGSISQSL